jgi:spore coat polysaccharide biosynthesis protein SpsF
MRRRAGIILQARMASSRLPGKALAPIAGQTILEHCLRRLMCAGVAPVVLATTERSEDQRLADIAQRLGASVFRGDTEDVLGRFVATADAFDFDHVVRATADNPGTDIEAAGRLLAALREFNVDYACEEGLPYGAAVEAITRDALVRAAREATQADDREHVTTYVKRNSDVFSVIRLLPPFPLRRPDVRVTVDTAADLEQVRALFERTGVEMPSLLQLIEAADAGPAKAGHYVPTHLGPAKAGHYVPTHPGPAEAGHDAPVVSAFRRTVTPVRTATPVRSEVA